MELPVLSHSESEARCRRCGVSCHYAVVVAGRRYVIEELHCRYLAKADDGKYGCTVYERRFEVAPWCMTAAAAIPGGNVASDCPYASHISDYRGKEWAPVEVREKILPAVRKKIIDDGIPLSIHPDSALKILTASGEEWTYFQDGDHFAFRRL